MDTSSSLSLTFYAIFEKIFPKRKKILTSKEIEESEKAIEEVSEIVETIMSETEVKTPKKIILRGNKNVKTETI